MQCEEIVTSTSRQYLDENGIIRSIALAGAEQTLDDAKETVKAYHTLCKGKKRPLLLNLQLVKSQSREVRNYYAGPECNKMIKAVAIMTSGSFVARMIGNAFLGASKTPVPTKLFTTEDEALAWLKGFVD